MNIALIGYGKMGREIEKIALERGHNIVLTIDIDNTGDLNRENLSKVDVAMEFSIPETAYNNIITCLEANTPVVSGTTGWHDRYEEIKSSCLENNQALFYASNFSLGVNIFFKINAMLAKIMNRYNEYEVSVEEIHHIHKKDAPSGTAITLASHLLEHIDRKSGWKLDTDEKNLVNIHAIRENEVPGTHTVLYDSPIDKLQLTHMAKSRKGFALGAVLAAEFIKDKKGVFGMDDLLNF